MKRSELLQAIYDNWGPLKRSMHAYFLTHFGTLQFSPAQLEMLKAIHAAQPISHKALAQRCRLTPGGVTQQLESLENAGLVERTTDPDDRRIVYLSLTSDGKTKLAEFKMLGKQLLRDVFSKLDDDELAAYLQAQRKLIDHFEAGQHHDHTED